MACVRAALRALKVTVLALVVVASFVFSSLGWRHYDTDDSARLLLGAAILISMYALMVLELVNRSLAALIGAAASVAAYDCLIEFVTMEEILQWQDLETLTLLLGMMIIVAVLSSSGIFDYLAVWSYKQSKGNFWLLVAIMSAVGAFLSAFLDNVSNMLLLSPTLIKLSELEHMDPRYLLMIMVIVSNIGGAATPVGDPPNLIIIGDELTSTLGITFSSFTAYCAPCVLLTTAAYVLYLRVRYKSKESFRVRAGGKYAGNLAAAASTAAVAAAATESRNSSDEALAPSQRKQLELLREFRQRLEQSSASCQQEQQQQQHHHHSHRSHRHQTAAPNGHSSAVSMRQLLGQVDERIASLEASATSRLGSTGPELPPSAKGAAGALTLSLESAGGREQRRSSRLDDIEVGRLMVEHSVKSKLVLCEALAVLVAVVALFFIQSLPNTNLTLGWVSLFGALTLLVLSSPVKLPTPAGPGHEQRAACPSARDTERKAGDKQKGNESEKENAETQTETETETETDEQGLEFRVRMQTQAPKTQEPDSGPEADNFERVVQCVEWSTLMFFFGLFIVMRVMTRLGVIRFAGLQIVALVDALPAGRSQAIGAISIVLWASALASACINNVPFTSMMIKVLGTMIAHAEAHMAPADAALAIKPLVFALALGACYGGNLTLLGASANLVTAGVAQRHGCTISFNRFFGFAAPAALISLAIANIYLVVIFVVLGL